MGPLIDRLGYYRVLVPAFLIAGPVVAAIGEPRLSLPLLYLVIFTAGICIVGAQPALNALASTLYPTEIRATGAAGVWGWGGPGQLWARSLRPNLFLWSSQALFLAAAVPASFSCIIVIGLAFVTRRKLHAL
jgi:AAHS family 4-hydroxybenzoate transporter-like MFS transporter